MTTIVWRGPWVATTQYNPGDAVGYVASSYVTSSEPTIGTPPPQDPSWDLLAGPGLVWMGPYTDSTGYVPGQAVGHMGSSFVAVADAAPNPPPPQMGIWDLLAAAGAAGAGVAWRGEWSAGTQYETNN